MDMGPPKRKISLWRDGEKSKKMPRNLGGRGEGTTQEAEHYVAAAITKQPWACATRVLSTLHSYNSHNCLIRLVLLF